MKLCSRLSIVLGRNFYEKRQILVSEPHLGKLGVTHNLVRWLIGKPMVNILFVLIDFFRCLLQFRSYEVKCVWLGCFHRGSTSWHSNFTSRGLFPISHSWRHKTRDTGLTDGEDCIPLHSLVLTQYRSVVERQTGGYAVAYTALAKLLRHAVKAIRCAVRICNVSVKTRTPECICTRQPQRIEKFCVCFSLTLTIQDSMTIFTRSQRLFQS